MKPPTKITREERQVKDQAMVVWQNITSIRSVHSQAVLYTRAPTLSLISFLSCFFFFCLLFLLRYRIPPSPSNNTETPAIQRNAIVQYILLTVLGTAAVKTQCLIGDKLLAHGVKGSTNGDTAIIASAQAEDGCDRERNLCMVDIVCRSRDKHTQGQDLIKEKRNMVSLT